VSWLDGIVAPALESLMRVFVAYGYTSDEDWVREFVIPVLQALEIEIIHGREIVGEDVTREVLQRIGSADALIGFLQKRTPYADGSWDSSPYVKQEIDAALALGKPVVRVIESGVKDPGGMLQGLQRLRYDPAARDRFLVDLTDHLRTWIQGVVSVRLAPDALVRELEGMGPDAKRTCRYKIRHRSHVEREGEADIVGEGGGLYVRLVGFRPDRSADLSIHTGQRTWWCQGVLHTHPFVTVHLN
jgi:hypothetical protein